MLMMGDFNQEPRGSGPDLLALPIALTRANHGDIRELSRIPWWFTLTAIDHILMGPVGAGILEAKVLRRWSDSDHWPMSAALNLRVVNSLAENRRTVRVRNATRATQARFLTDNRWEVLSSEIDEDTNPVEAVERVIDTFNEVGTDVGLVRDSVEGPRARRRDDERL